MKKLLIVLLLLFISYLSFGQGSVILSWNPSTDNVGVAGYCVWLDGERYDSTENTQYEFNLAAGTFLATVSAYDAAGNESEQSLGLPITIPDVTIPAIPDLISIEYLERGARISWLKSMDNVGVTGYRIYVNGELVDSTTINEYELLDMIPDREYYISISSIDAAGNESPRTSEFNLQLPEDKLTMLVYPNPVKHGIFTVRLENGIIKPNTTIMIVTIDGKTIYQVPVPISTVTPHEVNFGLDLQNGMYIVVVAESNRKLLSSYLTVMGAQTYSTEHKTPINRFKYFTIEEDESNVNGLNNKVNLLYW